MIGAFLFTKSLFIVRTHPNNNHMALIDYYWDGFYYEISSMKIWKLDYGQSSQS